MTQLSSIVRPASVTRSAKPIVVAVMSLADVDEAGFEGLIFENVSFKMSWENLEIKYDIRIFP